MFSLIQHLDVSSIFVADEGSVLSDAYPTDDLSSSSSSRNGVSCSGSVHDGLRTSFLATLDTNGKRTDFSTEFRQGEPSARWSFMKESIITLDSFTANKSIRIAHKNNAHHHTGFWIGGLLYIIKMPFRALIGTPTDYGNIGDAGRPLSTVTQPFVFDPPAPGSSKSQYSLKSDWAEKIRDAIRGSKEKLDADSEARLEAQENLANYQAFKKTQNKGFEMADRMFTWGESDTGAATPEIRGPVGEITPRLYDGDFPEPSGRLSKAVWQSRRAEIVQNEAAAMDPRMPVAKHVPDTADELQGAILDRQEIENQFANQSPVKEHKEKCAKMRLPATYVSGSQNAEGTPVIDSRDECGRPAPPTYDLRYN